MLTQMNEEKCRRLRNFKAVTSNSYRTGGLHI